MKYIHSQKYIQWYTDQPFNRLLYSQLMNKEKGSIDKIRLKIAQKITVDDINYNYEVRVKFQKVGKK